VADATCDEIAALVPDLLVAADQAVAPDGAGPLEEAPFVGGVEVVELAGDIDAGRDPLLGAMATADRGPASEIDKE
jgi:hypothetical protein